MKDPDFIICAPLHMVFMSNGVLALTQLARAIEKAGRSAFMCAYNYVNGRELIFGIDFDTYVPKNDGEKNFVGVIKRAERELGIRMLKDFSPQHINECYVVYPEAMRNNALNAKRVVRYFLNKDGIMNGIKVNVGPDDFILAHSRVMHPATQHVCYFAEVNPIFHNEGTYPAQYRRLDITYVGKGAVFGVTGAVPHTVEITRTWPTNKDQLVQLLRNCRFFYTGDACSQINVEALACGAIPAFLDNGPWTDDELDRFEPGPFPRLYAGMTAGENFYDEFEVARTRYLTRIRELTASWDANVAEMIDKVDVHFSAGLRTARATDV
ncbi:hypothetical protein CY652_12785 [Burkholderia sp. WAC0059]|uniref:hypothetical protein n=1 Tax=Burkholderia sp. WAC0059 TaxID=2066022 RepID=UPI000C7EC287|nr:hypothetical protein [Burkholderia sp. WAC0059]PLZ01908.1 hypothetical protein CY652_12785 [Burkholderia sp. WAC0059]